MDIRVKEYTFQIFQEDAKITKNIKILQKTTEGTGSYIWEAAYVLLRFLEKQPKDFFCINNRYKRILDFSGGTGMYLIYDVYFLYLLTIT